MKGPGSRAGLPAAHSPASDKWVCCLHDLSPDVPGGCQQDIDLFRHCPFHPMGSLIWWHQTGLMVLEARTGCHHWSPPLVAALLCLIHAQSLLPLLPWVPSLGSPCPCSGGHMMPHARLLCAPTRSPVMERGHRPWRVGASAIPFNFVSFISIFPCLCFENPPGPVHHHSIKLPCMGAG